LLSLTKQTNKNFEVVIVDNSKSFLKIKRLVNKFKNKLNIVLCRVDPKKCIFSHDNAHKGNYNPALQQNIGVKISSGGIIVLSSPEVVNAYDNVRIITNYFNGTDKRDKIALYGWVEETAIKNGVFDFNERISSHEMRSKIPYRGKVGACCRKEIWDSNNKAFYFLTAMRKKCFFEIGGIEEKFMAGLSCEDVEFYWRMVKNDFKFDLNEEVAGIHLSHDRTYLPEGHKVNRKICDILEKPFYMLGNPNHNWGSLKCVKKIYE